MAVLRSVLVNRGYFEAITYSFVDPDMQQLIDPEGKNIELRNPLSSEMSVMRSTLWPGLLQAVRHNLNRQHPRVRLFEVGMCFRQEGAGALEQINKIAGVICGDILPEQWGAGRQLVDFFDIKADVEALLALTGRQYVFDGAVHPALHPGQSASISLDGQIIGCLGTLHPELLKKLDIEQTVYIFELSLDVVKKAGIPKFSPLSRYPEVRRDLAIVVDEKVTSGAIQDCIYEVSSSMLRNIQLFDIYRGKGVDQGRKSVALGLILQDFSRTLTDQDVDSEVENIVSTLKHKFAATLRE
jgi:phenylalanyl-tRNA synthetase beta chain